MVQTKTEDIKFWVDDIVNYHGTPVRVLDILEPCPPSRWFNYVVFPLESKGILREGVQVYIPNYDLERFNKVV